MQQQIWQPGEGGPGAENATMEYFIPAGCNGTMVVVAPGGGFRCLCDSYEGTDIARWLNGFGIAAAVVRYRVNAPYPTPFLDAARTMRLVRRDAAAHGIDPHRIGIMGFSAGGHVSAMIATGFGEKNAAEAVSSRPDFQILVYPLITMAEPNGHPGSRMVLLGENPDEAMIRLLSCEEQVDAQTPKAFIAHAVTDASVPVANSRDYAAALRRNGVPVEYLELPTGAHGLGCGSGKEWEAWQSACAAWLVGNGLAGCK